MYYNKVNNVEGRMNMKLMKKVTLLLAMSMTFNVPIIYASEVENHASQMREYGFNHNVVRATTSGDLNFVPEFKLYEEKRGSKVYLIISVNDTDVNVFINGSSNDIVRDEAYHFAYEVKDTKWYEVEVIGRNHVSRKQQIYIKANDNATSLELSKKVKDDGCYLVIKASDKDGIKSVSVNDKGISFNEFEGEVSYKVYNTGTYKVLLTDKYDNRTEKSLYIDINSNSGPKVDLSQTQRNGKTYLSVKVTDDQSIKKVTINGSEVTFPASGGTEEYEIKKSGTYKVVVTDKNGYTETKSLYVDTDQKVKNDKFTVDVSQNYKRNNTPGWYLLIKVSDSDQLASIKVNGTEVSYDTSKGMAQYYVPEDGSYTVVVTDKKGNTYTKTTFAAGNKMANTNAATSNTNGTKIIFKLNSKTWTKNGVAQEKMAAAPKVIRSRIYLPIRYIAYAVGIDTKDIQWDAKSKVVTIKNDSNIIKLKLGSKDMDINGQVIKMSTTPVTSGNHVMLPISELQKAFKNVQLQWDNQNKQLIIVR